MPKSSVAFRECNRAENPPEQNATSGTQVRKNLVRNRKCPKTQMPDECRYRFLKYQP